MVCTTPAQSRVDAFLSGDDARERIEASADLVQLYTGLIYRDPDLVREAAAALCAVR